MAMSRKQWYLKTKSIVLVMLFSLVVTTVYSNEADRIQPYSENPTYWQYKGKPVLLLGGTNQDNLFNHPNIGPDGLEAHLDLLVSVGGNYVRNTMSSRDRIDDRSIFFNDDNIYPFHLDDESGLYNLDQFNDAYWTRFSDFLKMTAERDIIVQIEIWDRWDYGPERMPNYVGFGWSKQPFNPKNNINYTTGQTGLDEEQWEGYAIFRTIPDLDDVPEVLAYQEAFVKKLLSISLRHVHVLYCISNETTSPEKWSAYWARFVRTQAEQAGIGVEVTEMWNHWDLTNSMHQRTFDHPDLYSFADTSQNNHQVEQAHWDNMLQARQRIANPPRPMNNVKIYGGEKHGGGLEEGTHKLWRNILAGCAASRFHRAGSQPGYYGAGLNEMAQAHLRSARLFTSAFDVFRVQPRNDLLSEREGNEAYCAAIPGREYALYFPKGGSVLLNMSDAEGEWVIKWLDILNCEWKAEETVQGGDPVAITAPGAGQWAAVLLSEN
jgi:hypothetical protein